MKQLILVITILTLSACATTQNVSIGSNGDLNPHYELPVQGCITSFNNYSVRDYKVEVDRSGHCLHITPNILSNDIVTETIQTGHGPVAETGQIATVSRFSS